MSQSLGHYHALGRRSDYVRGRLNSGYAREDPFMIDPVLGAFLATSTRLFGFADTVYCRTRS
jgi:hypothetical protein